MNVAILKNSRGLRLAAVAAVVMTAAAAHADTVQFVTNGNFEQTTSSTSAQLGTNGQSLTGWSSTGYNFLFTPGSADTTGANGSSGNVQLWGPGNGSSNGLTGSPAGGNFVAMDGAYDVGPLSQTLTGLTVGQQVVVSFYFAGAQQSGFDGNTTEGFDVSLGNDTQNTVTLQNGNHGFTGWQQVTMDFTATSTSETLSFLAFGTPSGEPPFSLLDGVSATQQSPVPEPGSLALLATGMTGIAGLVRRRFKKA